jgi:hypothetical protein
MPQRPSARARVIGLALATALAAVTLASVQLFYGPDVGAADNGDGWRVMCQEGRRPYPRPVLYTGVVFTYVTQPKAATERCSPSAGNPYSYRTSQTFLVRVARAVSGDSRTFDLRTLGLVDIAVVGLAFFFATLSVVRSRWPLAVILAVIGVLGLDTGWVTYFVSPLSEPAALVGSLLVLAAIPAWLGSVRNRWLRLAALGLLMCGGALLVLAKAQTGVMAPVIALLLLVGRLDVGRLAGRLRGRVVPGLAAGVLLALALVQVNTMAPGFERINKNDAVFDGVLVASTNVSATLRSLGLSPSLGRYAGHGWYPYNPRRLHDPAYLHFEASTTSGKIARYVLEHPALALRMFAKAAHGAAQARDNRLGNFAADTPAGRRVTYADRFDPATTLLAWASPISRVLFPVTWLVAALTGLGLLRPRSPSSRAAGGLLLFLGVGAAASTFAVIVGEGFFSLRKHQMLTAFYTAPLLLILPALAIGALVTAGHRCLTAEPTRTALRWWRRRGMA